MRKRTERIIDKATKYTKVVVDFPEKGDVITIAKEYGKPIGGKKVRVTRVFKSRNTESGWAMELANQQGKFSINWMQSRYTELVL